MLIALVALWLPLAGAAPPEPPAAPAVEDEICRSAPPDPDAPFPEELDRAKRLYRLGCHTWALAHLSSLDVRRRVEAVPDELDLEARLYLGEVLFVLDRPADARRTFEAALLDHPDATMGLLEHDPDVADLFRAVKAELQARRPVVPVEPDLPPRPRWTYLPYGIGHLRKGDSPRFLLYGGGQLAFATVAAVTWAVHRRTWPGPVEEEEINNSLRVKAVNYGATLGFVAVYLASQVDAGRRWRAEQRARLDLTPTRDGAAVGVRGRF